MNLWIESNEMLTNIHSVSSLNNTLPMRGFLLVLAILGIRSTAGAAGQPLIIDPSKSTVGIAVKSTIDSFVAHLDSFESGVTLDPATGRPVEAWFQADFNKIRTGKNDRDRDMNTWQRTDTFPTVRFEATGIEPSPGGGWTVRGTLRLHGVDHRISFPFTAAVSNSQVVLDGTAVLDTRDFGLPVIRKLWLLKVDPFVHVHFHLQGRPAAPSGRATSVP